MEDQPSMVPRGAIPRARWSIERGATCMSSLRTSHGRKRGKDGVDPRE